MVVYVIINSIVIYTTLATKCLKDEAKKIYDVLKTGDIKKSRIQLSYIVGRDTENLSEKEIIRATVETVAENTVDGLIAPLFYARTQYGVFAFASVYSDVRQGIERGDHYGRGCRS